MRVRSKRDILIPAGTVFEDAPRYTERIGDGHVSTMIGLSPDSSGELVYSIDEDQLKGQLYEFFEEI